MTDREKVIKGLECCASMNGSACRECPYSSECVVGEASYQTGTAHLAADALALLKEQEAVVRCKDCKNRFDGCCYNRKSDRTNFGVFVADDWFCGDGERK